jgi:hypothetical protein
MICLLSELVERLPFNLICCGPQKFASTEIPLAHIKAVNNNWGGTVNDVVLTTVTMAASITSHPLTHGANIGEGVDDMRALRCRKSGPYETLKIRGKSPSCLQRPLKRRPRLVAYSKSRIPRSPS